MKKRLLLFGAICFAASAMSQQILFTEDFDTYTNNGFIAAQSPNFTTWNNLPGSSEDALVSQDQASSGSQSLKIESSTGLGPTDLIVPFNNYTTGIFTTSFNLFVVSGSGGYFNMQKSSNSGVEWAFDIFFNNNGSAQLTTGGVSTNFSYQPSQWTTVDISVNLNTATASLSIGGSPVHSWNWNQTTNTTSGINQVGAINFFAGSPTGQSCLYYIDDLTANYQSNTVGIDENNSNMLGSIYPNPATDKLIISKHNPRVTTVTIYDLSGKVVLYKKLIEVNTSIDINHLKKGVYLVEMNDQKNLTSEKLIIN